MFWSNHTKDYHTLLIWTISRIKKILKKLLTHMISLSEMRYVYLMNEGKNDYQSHQSYEGQRG